MTEFRRGFKALASRLAAEERAGLELGPIDPLDPWLLAQEHGIEVVMLSELGRWNPRVEAAVQRFASDSSGAFSAMVLRLGLGAFIVENDTHALTRRRANVSHEMGHVLLEHEFTLEVHDGQCRQFDPQTEAEAAWVAGELLVPQDGALHCARTEMSDDDVARLFGVSPAVARMRMNASGARKRASREQRSWGR